jgi:hypothetical protein
MALVSRSFSISAQNPWLWKQLYMHPRTWPQPVVCHHQSEHTHDWKILYKQRYLKTRLIKRHNVKEWQICEICSCTTITKSPQMTQVLLRFPGFIQNAYEMN